MRSARRKSFEYPLEESASNDSSSWWAGYFFGDFKLPCCRHWYSQEHTSIENICQCCELWRFLCLWPSPQLVHGWKWTKGTCLKYLDFVMSQGNQYISYASRWAGQSFYTISPPLVWEWIHLFQPRGSLFPSTLFTSAVGYASILCRANCIVSWSWSACPSSSNWCNPTMGTFHFQHLRDLWLVTVWSRSKLLRHDNPNRRSRA